MAKITSFHRQAHDALHDTAELYHQALHDIRRTEEKCRLQRALIKATASAELNQVGAKLKISNEAVGHMMALCW